MSAEGENAVKHMMRKYGRSAEEVASGKEMLMARGQAIGFRFDLEKRAESSPTRCVNLKRSTASTASIRYRPWSSMVVTWCPVHNRSSTTNKC